MAFKALGYPKLLWEWLAGRRRGVDPRRLLPGAEIRSIPRRLTVRWQRLATLLRPGVTSLGKITRGLGPANWPGGPRTRWLPGRLNKVQIPKGRLVARWWSRATLQMSSVLTRSKGIQIRGLPKWGQVLKARP